MTFCATCRCTLCAACVPSHLHHYLITRPTPSPPHQPPCQSCADVTSLEFLHSQGHLEDAHIMAVTSSLARLQVLFLNGSVAGCSRLGAKCDSWGALLLEAAQGLALEGDASSSSSSNQLQQQQQQQHVLIRALHRCPMFSLTRVSGTKASLSLYHPRAPEALAFAALHLGALRRAGISISTITSSSSNSLTAKQLSGTSGGGVRRDTPSPLASLVQGHQSHVGLKPAAVDALLALSPNWDPTLTPLPPGTPSLLLLPPPRLWSPGGGVATNQQQWRALEACPPSPRPPPRLLRTVVELREWVRGAMQGLCLEQQQQEQEQRVCAISVETKSHGGGIGRVALFTPYHHKGGSTVVFYMDTLGSSLVNIYGGRGSGSSGSGTGTGSGAVEGEEDEGEGGERQPPHALSILHPLLPLLLHPGVLKVGPSPHQFTHPLASIAGIHAINVLFLSALQEMSLEEEKGEKEGRVEERERERGGSSGVGSTIVRAPTLSDPLSWEAFGRNVEDLYAKVHAYSTAGGPTASTTTTNAAAIAAAFHAASYVSNLSVLAPPPLPMEKGQQVKRAFPGSEGGASSTPHPPTLTPLSTPPWYYTCPGCKQQGHFLVDCQRAITAGGAGRK